jgi:acyl-CoA thioesterase I
MTAQVSIAAIGDSVVYGRNDPHGGWVGRLRAELESRDQRSAVFNLGVGGQNSSQVLLRLAHEIAPRIPDTVIFGCGLNDLRSKSPDSPAEVSGDLFCQNLERAVTELRKLNVARIFLAQINPIDLSPGPIVDRWYTSERWREYNAIIARVASREQTALLRFADLADFTIASGSLSDPIHPSSDGHARMTAMAIPMLTVT